MFFFVVFLYDPPNLCSTTHAALLSHRCLRCFWSWQRRRRPPSSPSAVQHVALPHRVWLPSRIDEIFTGVKRCILLIQCEILLLSALFPIRLFTIGRERQTDRERASERESKERVVLFFWLCILRGAEA